MKRIISIILIAAISLQTVGCYLARELTLDDLRNTGNKEVIKVVTNDSREFTLQNPLQSYNRFKWSLDENNIYIYYNVNVTTQNSKSQTLTKIINIPFSSIKYISTDIYDSGLTLLCITGILVGLVVVVGIVGGIASAAFFNSFSSIGKK